MGNLHSSLRCWAAGIASAAEESSTSGGRRLPSSWASLDRREGRWAEKPTSPNHELPAAATAPAVGSISAVVVVGTAAPAGAAVTVVAARATAAPAGTPAAVVVVGIV